LIPTLRSRLTRGLTVFVFHDVTATPSAFQQEGRSSTSPEVFERQIDWIAERFDLIAPTALRRLGGSGELPRNAAMITFDDSWAGVFRLALPMLAERGIPALCFVNMGTVAGDPDLAAVSRYEHEWRAPLDLESGGAAIEAICERYANDPGFRDYQGETATHDDLLHSRQLGTAWLGSHLYHHWDVPAIASDLYEDSFRRNTAALARYENALPVFATPRGYAGDAHVDAFEVPFRCGAKIVFVAQGGQNRSADSNVLDRVWFPPEPSTSREWWYATHRRRVLRGRAR
jgi:peptidoglycan/xylan/chitin deacetylase (PgdA/CDA1 family)